MELIGVGIGAEQAHHAPFGHGVDLDQCPGHTAHHLGLELRRKRRAGAVFERHA